MIAARKDYAGTVELAPLDALLYTVRRGAQLVQYWQQRVIAAEDDETLQLAADREQRALGDLNRWAKNAVDGGVAKMQVEIASRLADTVVAAAEGALAALEAELGRSLSVGERTAFAGAFGVALSRLEGGTIEAAARDV